MAACVFLLGREAGSEGGGVNGNLIELFGGFGRINQGSTIGRLMDCMKHGVTFQYFNKI